MNTSSKSVELENHAGITFKDDQTDNEALPIPSYVGKTKELERQALLKQVAFLEPLQQRLFNRLCDYVAVSSENSPVIDLEKFSVFADEKGYAEFSSAARNDAQIKKLNEILGLEGLGIVEITEYDDEGGAKLMMLSEKDDEQTALYKKVEKYLMANLQDVKEKRGRLKTDVELLKEFKLYDTQLEEMFVHVSVSELSQEKIKQLTAMKKSIISLNLEHPVGKVVFPSPRFNSIIFSFIVLVYDYYKDSPNDNLRNLIKDRLDRQKLNVKNIVETFKQARLQDNYFLFFSQLFFAIMNNLSQKFSQQNVMNSEVYNQLVASRTLSSLSFNQRESMRKEEKKAEMRNKKLEAITNALIMKSIRKGSEDIYYPLTIEELMNTTFQITITENAVQQQLTVKIKDDFTVEDVKQYIDSLNNIDHSIKEIIVFSAGRQEFYVHRVRLLQSMWGMIGIEAARVRRKIVEEWSSDLKQMLGKIEEKELERLIEQELVSTFFRSYLAEVQKILLGNSSTTGKNFDLTYMLTRFFLTEREYERLPIETGNLIYLESEFKKKKNYLKSFFNTIFEKDYTSKDYTTLFKLNLRMLKEETLAVSNVGLSSRMMITVVDILRDFKIDVLADLIMNMVMFLGKIFSLFSFNRENDEEQTSTSSSNASDASEGKLMAHRNKKTPSIGREMPKKLKGKILEANPELKQDQKLEMTLDDLSNKWNTKLGNARVELQERIDGCIENFISKSDPKIFIDRDIQTVMHRFTSNYRKAVTEITDTESLKKYIYLRGAQMHFKK